MTFKSFTFIIAILLVSASKSYPQIYQLPNGGFELWDGANSDAEPTNWNSFPTAACDLSGVAALGCGSATSTRHSKSTDKRPGSSGQYSVKIFATQINLLGSNIIANGNITTGQIRIGNTTPSSPQNYNITRINNSNFSQEFHGKPDSISFWAKFICPSATQDARISTTIHGNYSYRDPESSDPSCANYVVAQAIHNFPRGTQEWTKYTIPFSYNFPSNDSRFILITFTTNKVAGEGSSSDALHIDDIEMIYNPRLSNIKVDGIDLSNFNPEITEYFYVAECFSNPNVTASTQSQNAELNITQANTGNNNIATITVSTGNISRIYKVHFSFKTIIELYAETCQNNIFSEFGFNISPHNTPGIYTHELNISSENDCDTLKILSLRVFPEYFPDTIQIMICENSSYNFYGKELTEPGVYDSIFITQHNCDSIVVLNLSVGDYYLSNIFGSICFGEVYDLNGFYKFEEGTDTLLYTAANLCDSLVVLHLTVNPIDETIIFDTVTQGDFYNHHGFSLFVSTQDSVFNSQIILENTYGCDSTVNLKLRVTKKPHNPIPPAFITFSFQVYPNPIKDKMKIEIESDFNGIFYLGIYDNFGRKRLETQIEYLFTEIDLSNLNSGIYLLKVYVRPDEYKTKKIIIE